MSRVTISDKVRFRTAVSAIVSELEHREHLIRSEAQAQLLTRLGLSTASRPTLLEVWTQPSRLRTVSTIEEQYLAGLAWLGFHLLNRDPEWLESLLQSTVIELDYPLVNRDNRQLLKALFRKVRLDNMVLAEDTIEETLDKVFSLPYETSLPPALTAADTSADYGFQINRIHTDAANHLYIELCGVTRGPLIFAVRNERTGFTWQSLGSRLTGPCKVYRVIWDISSPDTWYAIDIICPDDGYGGHVRVLTSDSKPYFCNDVRIEGPGPGFTRRIDVD